MLLIVSCKRESVFDEDFDPRWVKSSSSSWDFTNSSQYTYDSNHIAIANGKASLKTVDQKHSTTELSYGTHVGTYLASNNSLTILQNNSSTLSVRNILTSKSSDLIGYWRFEGSLADSSGNGNTAALSGSTTTSDYKVGAQSFNASSSSGNLDNIIDDFSSPQIGAISLWVKPVNLNGSHFRVDFDSGDYITLENSASTSVRGAISANGVYKAVTYDLSTLPLNSSWYHVVMVWDLQTANTINFYLNGSLVSSVAQTMDITGAITATRLVNSTFSGLLDEVAIWRTALSSEEIYKLYYYQSQNYTSLSSYWTPHWSNVIGYWQMDGTWHDSSGNQNHGSASADTAFSTDSKVGGHGGLFDGDTVNIPYLLLPTNSQMDSLQDSNFTLMGWFKPFTLPPNTSSKDTSYAIVVKNGHNFGLRFDHTGKFIANIIQSDTSTIGAISSSGQPLNQFYHVAAVYDFTDKTITLYLDGVAISSTSFDGTVWSFTSTNRWRIGASNSAGSFVGPTNGVVDDVAMWSTSLSASDIKLIYDRQKQKYSGHYDSQVIDLGTAGAWSDLSPLTPLPFYKPIVATSSESSSDYTSLVSDLSNGLVAYWPLDEVSTASVSGGYDFEDKTINNNHCTKGAGSLGKEGVIGQALINGYASCGNILPFTGTSPFSFAGWFKTTLNGAGQYFNIIQKRVNPGSGTEGWICYIAGSNGKLNCKRTVTGTEAGYTSTSTFNDGKWQHFVVTYDGSILKGYINGIFDSSAGDTRSMADAGSNLIIGDSTPDHGAIDDIGIWNYALNATEVNELYRRGANRIKYQIKSCIDSSCNCKSYSSSPTGSSADCDGDGISNTSDNSDMHSAKFIGPGGNELTYYSELFNRASSNMTFDCSNNTTDTDSNICVNEEINLTGDVNPESQVLTFGNMASSALLNNNRYFQYRIIMEAQDNSSCSGAPCLPELTSIEVGPAARYYGASPTIASKSPILFKDINSISFKTSGSCTLTYQISGDGMNYYYYDGSQWLKVTGENVSESSSATAISTNIKSLGSEQLYFKAFMTSDTTQSCSLENIEILRNQ